MFSASVSLFLFCKYRRLHTLLFWWLVGVGVGGTVCSPHLGICAGPQLWVNHGPRPRHPTWRHPLNKDPKCCVGAYQGLWVPQGPSDQRHQASLHHPRPSSWLLSAGQQARKDFFKRKESSTGGTFSPDGQRVWGGGGWREVWEEGLRSLLIQTKLS